MDVEQVALLPLPPLGISDLPPVGARLALHLPRWRALFPRSPWLLQVVAEGFRLSFSTPPPLTRHPKPISLPADPVKKEALLNEVRNLLLKQAVIKVREVSSLGFYSHLFLVPKPGGKWRPIIDLSALNAHLVPPRFKMETSRSIRMSIQQGDWAVSLDLTDAYLHVPIHPTSQRFLRFAIQDTVYMFQALPFGLCLSPWIFTKIMNAVTAIARLRSSSMIAAYLDDILVKNVDQKALELDRDHLLSLLSHLGFLVSREKSDLVPKQSFDHLGMHFNTVDFTVGLTQKRIAALAAAVSEISQVTRTSRRQVAHIVGLCQAAAELLPLGRLRLRPLQWAVADWLQHETDWDQLIPMERSFLQALQIWGNEAFLHSTVPIREPSPTRSICTDASQAGWGAHLLPEFSIASGLWSEQESALHVNELEMLAVLRALQFWAPILRGLPVLILSDNSTVVAYLSKQGGTRSRSLCNRAIEVLTFADASNIPLQARHIPGRLNVMADALSRQRVFHTEWTLSPQVFSWILQMFPKMTCDLFATRFNAKLPRFVSPFPDPTALAVDALSCRWMDQDLYAFPPTSLVPKVLIRLLEFTGEMTLIAPLSPHRAWFSLLISRLLQVPIPLPVTQDLLSQPITGVCMEHPESLRLHVFRLYGGPLRPKVFQIEQWLGSLEAEGSLL